MNDAVNSKPADFAVLAAELKSLGYERFRIYENRADIGGLWRADAPAATECEEIWYRDVELSRSTPVGDFWRAQLAESRYVAEPEACEEFRQTSWTEDLLHGPIFLLPAFDRNLLLGFLVVFSSTSSRLMPECQPVLSRLASALAAALSSYRCRRMLQWHEEADKALANIVKYLMAADVETTAVHSLGKARPESRPSRRFARRLKSFDGLSPLQLLYEHRKYVANEISKAVATSFKLSRCAVLLPSSVYPDSWTLEGAIGFPVKDEYGAPIERYQKHLYHRGEGLSGSALLCGPDEVLSSSDIENDRRWSKKFGNRIVRRRGDIGPMGFLGVPLHSRFDSADNRPYGVLICMRSRYGDPNASAFTSAEKTHFKSVAVHISYALDTLRWREDQIRRRGRQLRMSRVWASHRNDRQIFTDALRLLQKETPFRRLLLSVVDPDREQILGRASVGFDDDLVKDTRRRIWKDAPDRKEDEDILSRICRERKSAPFIVDPHADPKIDDYAANVNQYAKFKHRVTNKLLLIPMVRYGGDVVGVVLAEFSDRMLPSMTPEELQRFSIYANQLASLIELHHSMHQARREQRIIHGLLNTFGSEADQFSKSEYVIRTLLTTACREYDFRQGVIYKYDNAAHALEGTLGYGVNECNVRQTVYPLEAEDPRPTGTPSFAKNVFLRRECEFLPRIGDPERVDEADRLRVGIDESSSALGIPLTHHDRVYGVMVLCGDSDCVPTHQCMSQLMNYGQIAALALAIEAAARELERTRRANRAQDVIVRQLGMIAAYRAAQSPVTLDTLSEQERQTLQVIVTDAAELFDAQISGLFLADESVALPHGGDGNADSDPRKTIGSQRGFRLRAGIGYNVDIHATHNDDLTYYAHVKGLTSHVLGTVEAALSQNVTSDNRWSRRLEKSISSELQEKPRTWMGVPVVIQDGGRRHLFGALTFTRLLRFEKDTNCFDHRDVAVAENIAWLIALALYNKLHLGRVAFSLRRILGLFDHEGFPNQLDDVRNSYSPIIRQTIEDERVPQELRERIERNTYPIENIVAHVLCGFRAFGEYASQKLLWDFESSATDIRAIVQGAVDFCRVKAGDDIDIDIVAADDCPKCRVDQPKLMFIMLCLLDNAIKACVLAADARANSGSNIASKIQVGLSFEDEVIRLQVKDNGCGIKADRLSQIYEEGVSHFKSSGLGLAIVKAFVDCVYVGNRKAAIECTSAVDVGTTFDLTIPVVT